MIKNNKTKKIKHIVNGLYKIKQVNRRSNYSIDELRKLIMNSKHGRQVIIKLREENITCQWLKEHNQTLIQIILGPKLKDK